MRIQSKFKDYYDYISHQFGSDPNCVYNRGPIKQTKELEDALKTWSAHPSQRSAGYMLSLGYFEDTIDKKKWDIPGVEFDTKFVVAGKLVIPIIVRTFRHFDKESKGWVVDEYRYDPLTEINESILRCNWDGEPHLPKLPDGEKLDDLIRAVGHPVFTIKSDYRLSAEVEERVPILKDLGVPALYTAPVMWQNIYTTLTSVLRKDPDKEVPVEISNDSKIHKAGFDLKSSFRHPINEKRKR